MTLDPGTRKTIIEFNIDFLHRVEKSGTMRGFPIVEKTYDNKNRGDRFPINLPPCGNHVRNDVRVSELCLR